MPEPFSLAIIADIHGMLPSLDAVLAEILPVSPCEIIVAGDFLGGPHPIEVLQRLRSIGCRFILGNGEVNMLKMRHGTAPNAWWTHRQFDLGCWIYHRLDEAVFTFLEGLDEHMVLAPPGTQPVRVVHGSPWDVNKLVFPETQPQDLSRALGMIPEDVLVFAHNHLPGIYRKDGKLAVNPGSVGNNLNGDPRASYATLTWDGMAWQPELHYVPHDIDAIFDSFQSSGFLDANRPLARAFLESILTAKNTALDFINFAGQRAKAQGLDGFTAIPDLIWLESEATFPWAYDF